jgi:hypothetical protein
MGGGLKKEYIPKEIYDGSYNIERSIEYGLPFMPMENTVVVKRNFDSAYKLGFISGQRVSDRIFREYLLKNGFVFEDGYYINKALLRSRGLDDKEIYDLTHLY